MNVRLVQKAQRLIAGTVPGPIRALDATVGNGRDTLFLAHLVGQEGHVWGIDIQPDALLIARARIAASGLSERVTLISGDHSEVRCLLPPAVQATGFHCAMFNLGFLPGGDKRIVTRPESTISALTEVKNLLVPGGSLSIIAYPGHPGGREEADAVDQWLRCLSPGDFKVDSYMGDPEAAQSPILHLVKRNTTADLTGGGDPQ